MTSRSAPRIYFSASISGGRDDAPRYAALISALEKLGNVLTDHIGSSQLTDLGEDGPADREIFDRDILWLDHADVIIAEVTTPSLGVGYEIAYATGRKKPVVCLFRPGIGRRLSAMIRGNPAVTVLEYGDADDPREVAGRALEVAMTRAGPDVR